MANKSLFASSGSSLPAADTKNNAGGKAYKFEDRHCLAQIAATNCFNGTFYASAEANLKLAKDAAARLIASGDHEFVAKVAIYSRNKGYMKDMPAFLAVTLASVDPRLFRKVFRKVVGNGKMLRNVIQMARSGAVTGKKRNMSSGTFRNAIQEWFNKTDSQWLFKAGIGNDPSMRDILRMCRPKPNSEEKNALFAYFLGKDVSLDRLPEVVRQYERFKKDKSVEIPDVDFRMLDSLGLSDDHWATIARRAPWMMTRMNLNTFARHNVFQNKEVADIIAARLKDKEQIAKAKQFPYQLYTAWREIQGNDKIPFNVKNALQDAIEIAIDNVPALPGNGFVCVDSSGSMSSPITGYTPGRVGSSVTCMEVAGLIASSVVRKNGDAEVYTFSDSAKRVQLNPRDSVTTNTKILNNAGGGTNISVALRDLNAKQAKGDWVMYVSDNESWIDSGLGYGRYGATALAEEWKKFKARNPKAKLILCDLTPRDNSQIKAQPGVLQVGGFSDQVFEVIASFVEHGNTTDHWVDEINKISLD